MPPPSTPRLLIADDDDDIRSLLSEVVEGEGYAPTGAASSQQALDLLDAEIFDAVVTDTFSRPDRGTLEDARAIANKAYPTPVGVISGWQIAAATAAAHGLRFAMLKPFDLSQFLVEIARMLGDPLDSARSPQGGIARRYFAALDEKDWDALLTLCAEDVRFSGPQGSRFSAMLQGREALRRHSQDTFRVFADAKFRDLALYATPAGVAARYLGTWTKDGVQMQQAGAAVLHIEDGLIRRIGVETNHSRLDRIAPA